MARGDELVGHGHTNAERQGALAEGRRARAAGALPRAHRASTAAARRRGWLSPWISESRVTPDLLAETGYRYTLNWCHDDQPMRDAHAQRRSAVVGALPAGAERHPDDRGAPDGRARTSRR